MNLEPYAPAASLLLLALTGLVAFSRVRMLMKRYGLAELHSEAKTAECAQTCSSTHMDDYTREPPVALPVKEPSYRPEPEQRVSPEAEPVPGSDVLGEAPAPAEEEYVMTAPVELWFGEARVAVRPGSDTDMRFQRFAAVLLDELNAARG